MTEGTDIPETAAATKIGNSLRRYVRTGIGLSVFLVVGIGGWAALAHLSGAVIAPGTVVVDTNLKKVQHPTGGIVGELLVKDGVFVRNGDIIIRLDETVTRANLAVIVKSLDELEGRRARLEAERDERQAVIFPDILQLRRDNEIDIRKIIEGEQRLFTARKASRNGQKSQLRERIAQARLEIEGLEAQRTAKVEEIALIRSELVGVEGLYDKKLVPLSRVTALQREATRLDGERGQFIAAIAQARGKIAETELQIIQLDQDLLTEVLKELREIEGKQGEYVERRIAAEDQLKRIDIRAPQDGIVHQLAVHTVGGVITAGEVLMLVVPQSDALTVEAHVSPQDIDQVSVGQEAVVRLSAFSQRTTPELFGKVTRVSADLTKDPQTQLSWYTVRVELPESELQRLGKLKLVPGMPAEAHIQTGERTTLSYLIKPLADQFAKAFREE